MNLDQAIEDYLAYLDVERGLAGATIRAYRGDLRDFARSVATPGETTPGRGAAGTAPPIRPSATSRDGPAAAARARRASLRRACVVVRPR